jgi:hypothetical protein
MNSLASTSMTHVSDLVIAAGSGARIRFLEFFAANIRNRIYGDSAFFC